MFDEAGDERPWLSDPPTVTAILVAHNGSAWLPKALSSLGVMDFAPTAWRAVDVSSTDGSGDLLRETFGVERMTYAPSGTGFGSAVKIGLQAAPPSDWIWLLHDDSSVQPATLAALLDEALSGDDIAIVGPKVREWPSLRRLLEVGITISGTAARVTGLEPGEPDAGQHDRPRDVLAVSTAGMLIRRDVWDAVGGFDEALPLFFDDVDLGWRVARAGYRIRTAPKAVVFHAEASARGNRHVSTGDVSESERRRAALFTSLANVSRGTFWWQYVRLFLGTLIRALGFLIAKAPEEAGDELVALKSVYAHPRSLRAARAARARTSNIDAARIRHLFPSPWLPYQHGFDSLREVLTTVMKPEAVSTGGRRTSGRRASAFDATAESAQGDRGGPSFWRRRPWLTTVLVLVILSLVAARGLLTGGSLHGGGLLPAPDTAGGWWQLYFERWHNVGIGSDVSAPPYALVLALAALPVWFEPSLLIAVLMLGAMPLAAMTAHRASGRWFGSRAVRIVWAITYALVIVATGAVAQGRIGTVVAMTVAPVVVGATASLLDRPGWQAGLRLGLWLALATAFAPVTYLGAIVVFAAVAVSAQRAQRRQQAPWQSLLVALVVPALLTGAWMWQRVVVPFRWWWEAGLADAHVGSLDVSWWEIILGRVGGPGAASPWLSIGIVALGILTLFSGRRRTAVSWCWVAALVGLVITVAGSSMTFTPAPGPDSVPVWCGVGAVAWLGGLAAAAFFVIDDVMARPIRGSQAAKAFGAAVVVIALVAPIGTGAWWLIRGVDDPLTRGDLREVPAYLASRPAQKTLVVEGGINGGVRYDVVVADGLSLGQEAVQPSRADSAGVTRLLATLLSNPTGRNLEALASYGISAIYAPARVDAELARRLDAAPGLDPSGSEDPDSRVWTLEAKPVEMQHRGGFERWLIAAAHVLVLIIAVVLTAPVRQRRRQL